MSNQPTQKKLTFNGKNAILGLFLLTLLNIIGPLAGVDPKLESGQMFYMVMAVVTAFMFPWLEVKDVDGKDQKTDS